MDALHCGWQMKESKHMGKATPEYLQVRGHVEAYREEGKR